MQILSRYIFREVFAYFAICLLTFTALILSARILKFADLIVNKGVGSEQVLKVFLAIIPTFLEIALPLSVLLGGMLAFSRLSGDSEIIVIRASGIKILQLLSPIIIYGLITVSFAYYLSFELRPWGYQTLNRTLFEIARSRTVAGISPGLFNKMGNLTIYAEKIDYETGKLENVMIDDRRNLEQRKTIFSKTGKIGSNPAAQMIMIDLAVGTVHEQVSKNYQVTEFDENRMLLSTADVYGDSSLQQDKKGREFKLNEILDREEQLELEIAESVRNQDSEINQSNLKSLRKDLSRLKIELAQRFSTPWACFFMAILAIPLGIMPPRTQKTWGASFSLSFGLLSFIVYFGLLTVGIALGESGVMNPHLAVWIPNLVLAIVCSYSIYKVNSEKWQSFSDALTPIISFFRRK